MKAPKQTTRPLVLLLLIVLTMTFIIWSLPLSLQNSVLVVIGTLAAMLAQYILKTVRQSFDKFWTDVLKEWLRKLFFPPKEAKNMEYAEEPHEYKYDARAAPRSSENVDEESAIRTEYGDSASEIIFVIILHDNRSETRKHH